MESGSAKKELNNLGNKMRSKFMTERGEEGRYTRAIERQTEKIPSGLFLTSSAGAIATSIVLKSLGFHRTANFVGLWVPTILVLGLYNKMVKLNGSESPERLLESDDQYH